MIEQLLVHLTPPPHAPESKKPPLQLYGIFNAEKYKNLWVKLECEWKFKHASLFSDEALEVSMNKVAPYLVHIPITHPRITTLLQHYGHGGTLFFWSEEGFGKVLKRMQNVFEIRSDEGDNGYLAFYRPEMWNTLAQSDSPIRYHFFEKSPCFFCEDDLDPLVLYRYDQIEQITLKTKIKLEEKKPG
jgi:hypothetical protein